MENNDAKIHNLLQTKFTKREFEAYLNIQFDFLLQGLNSNPELTTIVNTIDLITFYNFTNFPLPIAQKLFASFTLSSPKLTRLAFITGLSQLYLGTFEERLQVLIFLFDFSQNGTIFVEDIKLLVLHFHHFAESTIEYKILLKHFDIIFKKNTELNRKEMSDFIKVYPDLFYYFLINFSLRKPFSEESIEYYNKNIKGDTEKTIDNKSDVDERRGIMKNYFPSRFLLDYFGEVVVGLGNDDKGEDELNDLNNFEMDICNVKENINKKCIRKASMFCLNNYQRRSVSTIHTTLIKELNNTNINNSTINPNDKPITATVFDPVLNTNINVILHFIGDDIYLFNSISNKEQGLFHSIISLKHLFISSIKDTSKANDKHSVHFVSQISIFPIFYCFQFNTKDEASLFINSIHKSTHYSNVNDYYYEISIINQGSFGIVYKYKSKESQKVFACKVLRKHKFKHNQLVYKMEQYICSLFSNINDIGLAKFYDIFEDDKAIYIIQKYYSHGNIGDFYALNGCYLPTKTINNMLKQICSSLKFLKTFGIVHRDLKIENILYSNDQTKIIDFGLSTILGKNEVIADKCGTIKYFAPELIQGHKYNYSVDIWSLGIIGYFLYYGKFPYEKSYCFQLDANILDDIISRHYYFPSRISSDDVDIDNKDGNINIFLKKCLEKDINDRLTINCLYNENENNALSLLS